MNRSSSVIPFCLSLALVYMFLFAQARVVFSGVDEVRLETKMLKERIERHKIRTAIVQMQFDDFRGYVSRLIPEKVPADSEQAYPLRQLASTLKTSDAYKLKLIRASDLMAKGKRLFQKEEYLEANTQFRKLIDHYSYSHHIIEAHYLLAEGLFLLKDFERCSGVVRSMVELFPENELTGFAMLRLGKIFQVQRRSTEAMEIYNTVLSSFPQRGLATQANQAIRDLDL